MKKLKKLLHSEHPRHEILAFAMMGIGLILICNGLYFFWPPFTVGFLNNNLVGDVFLVDGILLLRWALSVSGRIYANRSLLVATAGLLASKATAEFCHDYVSGGLHVVMAGFLGVIVLLFVFSVVRRTKGYNY